MAILKFRIYFEEDETVYRDVAIRHTQTFKDLHEVILQAYGFDNKHSATFFYSNEHWKQGREISLEKYDKEYKLPPFIMSETTIASAVKNPNQRFIYLYDFNKKWTFLVELINVSKEEDPRLTYPAVTRSEGIPPSQYGTKGLLGEKFADIEEKYDLALTDEGFLEKNEEGEEIIPNEPDTESEEEI